MIKKIINQILLFFCPIKVGNVYKGNPKFSILGSHVEYVLFGLKNVYGDLIWLPIPSKNAYILTLISEDDTHYKFEAECLCISMPSFVDKKWMKRTQQKRIDKKTFRGMIIDGKLKRSKK